MPVLNHLHTFALRNPVPDDAIPTREKFAANMLAPYFDLPVVRSIEAHFKETRNAERTRPVATLFICTPEELRHLLHDIQEEPKYLEVVEELLTRFG